MSVDTDPGPEWARKMQDRRRVPASVDTFDVLDAPWKVREASRASVWTALIMGLGNLLNSAIAWSGNGAEGSFLTTYLRLSPYFLQLVAGLVLLWMAARLHRVASPLLAWIVLVWCLSDVTMISHWLYGHYMLGGRAYPLLILPGLLGVRGTMRIRHLQKTVI